VRGKYLTGLVAVVEGSAGDCEAASWADCYCCSCSHSWPPAATHADDDYDDDDVACDDVDDGGDDGLGNKPGGNRCSADLVEAPGASRNNFRSSSTTPVTSHAGHVHRPPTVSSRASMR